MVFSKLSHIDQIKGILMSQAMTPAKKMKRKVPSPDIEEIVVSTPTPTKKKRSKKISPKVDDEIVFEDEINDVSTHKICDPIQEQHVVRKILEVEAVDQQQETTATKRKKKSKKSLVEGQIYRQFRAAHLGNKIHGRDFDFSEYRQRMKHHNFVKVFVSNDTTRNPDALTFWDSCYPIASDVITFKWSEDGKRLEGSHITNKRVSYSGNEYKDPDYEYSMAVRDSGTAELVLEKVKIFRIRPVVNIVPSKESKKSKENDLENRTRGEKIVEAMSKFGSKKANRNIASKTKSLSMKINDEDVTALQSTGAKNIASSSSQADDQSKDELGTSDLIPPRNVSATSPNEVYMLKDLIDERLASILTGYIESEERLEITMDMIKKLLPASFDSFIKPGQRILLPNDLIDREKILVAHYIDLLMRVYHLKSIDLRRLDPLQALEHSSMKAFLMEMFVESSKEAGNGNRTYIKNFLGDKTKDKILITAVILLLRLSNYCTIRVDEACKAFNVYATKMKSIGQLVGCHLEKKRSLENLIFKTPIYQMQMNKTKKRR